MQVISIIIAIIALIVAWVYPFLSRPTSDFWNTDFTPKYVLYVVMTIIGQFALTLFLSFVFGTVFGAPSLDTLWQVFTFLSVAYVAEIGLVVWLRIRP